MKLFRLSAAVLALAAAPSAFAQTQPIPGAVQANGQPANVQGTAIVVAPAGGGAGRGVVVAADRPLPVTCITGCSGGGGGGSTTMTATTANPVYTEGSTTNPLSSDLAGNLRVRSTAVGGALDTLSTVTTITNAIGIKGVNGSSIVTNANPLPVSDAGGSLTVDGTVGVSGTVATSIADGQDVVTGSLADPAWNGSDVAASIISLLKPVASAALSTDPAAVNQTQLGGTAIATNTGNVDAGTQRVVLASNQPAVPIGVSQGSSTSGQSGPLVQCAVTTSAPTYTTGQTSPVSCDLSGNLRVSGSSVPTGSAGSPNASVLSIQGVTSMTPLQIGGGTTPTTVASPTNALPFIQYTSPTGGTAVLYANTNGDSLATASGTSAQVTNSWLRIFNGTSGERTRSLVGADAGGVGTMAVHVAPTTAAGGGVAAVKNTAAANALVMKASPGNLYSFKCLNTSASAIWVLLFNATSAPADGAVTPENWWSVAANGEVNVSYGDVPLVLSTGGTLSISSTGPFTKTAVTSGACSAQMK